MSLLALQKGTLLQKGSLQMTGGHKRGHEGRVGMQEVSKQVVIEHDG